MKFKKFGIVVLFSSLFTVLRTLKFNKIHRDDFHRERLGRVNGISPMEKRGF